MNRQKFAVRTGKREIIQALRGRLGFTRPQADLAVNVVLQTMQGALKRGEPVELRGFGSFKVRDLPAASIQHPRTGARIQVAERRKVGFKPSSALLGS